jgi:adenylosuccinate lyase
MIPRYTRPDMHAIFEPENRFKIWLEIETLACEKMAEMGTIPVNVPQILREKGDFDIARIDEIEREVKHDVIAFLTSVAEYVGPDSRFVHQGLTSSDILDTALAVQLTQACDILLADLKRLVQVLRRRAEEHVNTVTIGRSHGIHAEPTTFGVKLAGHLAAFGRARDRLLLARADIGTCALSGAVGTFATIDPAVEDYVAEKLGLTPETVSTQVIPRDRHAFFISVLGVIASSIENLAIEIRHLQRTEVREAEEYFSPGQKGSSAMPHKRNPVLTENLTGLARIVRGAVTPALENVALWHERDISHSAVERVMFPDACIALDFALNRLADVVDKLLVYPDQMQTNLDKMGGLVYSQRVLLALTQKGVSREDAYRMVQDAAMKVWESKGATPLRECLGKSDVIGNYLDAAALDELCRPDFYQRHARTILNRALDATAKHS